MPKIEEYLYSVYNDDTLCVAPFGTSAMLFYKKNKHQLRLLFHKPGLYEIRVEKKFFRQTFYVQSFHCL